jgi:hypothetical protein
MFDPKLIAQTMQNALAGSGASQSALQSSFMAGAGAMQVDGPGNAAGVTGAVVGSLRSMTQQLEGVAQALQADANAHQATQQSQQPADFAVDTPDLRETEAQGFPGEQGKDFFDEVKQ